MGENLNIFAIYSLEDIAVMQQIAERLESLGEGSNIAIWKDDPIKSGEVWKPQIESRLHKADIFLLFISNAFMYSEFVKQLEFKTVIDRYKEGTSKVIPIILDDCPWGIDFEADEYTFSFKELQVLPEKGKPLKTWDSDEEAYANIITGIKSEIPALAEMAVSEESKTEEQTALSFGEEEVNEEETTLQEDETKTIVDEARLKKEAEAKSREEEEKKLQEEAELQRKAEEQRLKKEEEKRWEEAESKRRANEQRESAAEESRKLEEKKRLEKEAEQRRQSEEAKRTEQESQQQFTAVPKETNSETRQENTSGRKKRLLIGTLVALLAIIGIWIFNKSSDEDAVPSTNTNTMEVEDLNPVEKNEIEPVVEEESLTELAIGDRYQGGLVFALDSNGKSGKIVHIDDAGPMPWLDAMIIHDQLGKGWRLPTLDELKILYRTLGQGASNSAEFADKLYWSATLYDDYQARLLQFRTGNTSYHYNKEAEHRKFLVRAVRDFSR